jgi:adenylate cyclase
VERKLTTILAADVVGYSSLMENDEAGTFDRLRAHRKELFEPEIVKHHGRIFKLMGDGLLAEFGSVVDAVECAVALQRGLAERNANVPDDQRIEVRIGINLGEVIVEGEDRLGEGVNIASRLEQLAEPGGICVSGKVTKEVEKKLSFGFEPMGEQKVKNITEPIPVFKVKLDGMPLRTAVRRREPHKWTWATAALALDRRILGLLLFAVLGTVAAGIYLAASPTRQSFPPISPDIMAFPLPPKPSVAVLPFNVDSTDTTEVLVGRGLSSGVRQRLSKRGDLFIIAEHSSFQLDGKVGAGEAARRLGVRYVLNGHFERQDGYVLIDARLIDALAGREIWHQHFNVESEKLARASDEVATNILAALNLNSSVSNNWPSPPSESAEVWLLHLRAEEKWLQAARDENAEARRVWQQAYSRDPNFLLALLMIGWTEWADARFAWREDWFGALDRAERDAQTALVSQSLEGSARDLLGSIYLQRMDHLRALEFARQAVAADPNEADAWGRLAVIEAFAGDARAAIEAAQTAMRLNPYYPAWYLMPVAEAYRLDGNNARAIETALQEIRRSDNFYARLRLAIYFTQAGERDRALEQVRFARKSWPTLTISDWGWLSRFKDPRQTERDRNILSRLGIPEFVSFDCLTHNQCP